VKKTNSQIHGSEFPASSQENRHFSCDFLNSHDFAAFSCDFCEQKKIKVYDKMYECKRCGYSTSRRNDMYKHFNRLKICDSVYRDISIEECIENMEMEKERNVCEYCKKTFIKKKSILKHFCTEKIKRLEKELENKILELSNQPKNTINNNTNCNNTYNIININSFHNSDYSRLPPEEVFKCCLMDTKEQNVPRIENLLEKLHFDKNFPENHNIKIENRRTNKILTFNGESFIEEQPDILDTILKKLEEVIEESIDNKTASIYMTKLRNHLGYMEKDEEYSNVVTDEILKSLYNNRKIVNDTHKTSKK
jgi:hypothetical protein